MLRNATTGVFESAIFAFDLVDSSNAAQVGKLLIDPGTTNKARIALLPGQNSTVVRATTIGTTTVGGAPTSISGFVTVQNYCGPDINGDVTVIASPNVIPCGGTAQLTATARDQAGAIIPGVGFSWSTDVGGLIVGPPNNANATAGTATLTLTPGMGTEDGVRDAVGGGGVRFATVTVRVGGKTGIVKVQQYCPGVITDGSVVPGKIVLVPSNSSISCSGNAFIGAIVKDSKGQVPLDENVEEVTFIATSGFFTAPGATGQSASTTTTRASASSTPVSGASSSGGSTTTTTTSGQFIAKPARNGALNVIFNAAPDTNGQVTITAAAGASFGTTSLVVNCPSGAGAVAGAGGGSLRVPNTGEGFEGLIRPPNTGDAGLMAAE